MVVWWCVGLVVCWCVGLVVWWRGGGVEKLWWYLVVEW